MLSYAYIIAVVNHIQYTPILTISQQDYVDLHRVVKVTVSSRIHAIMDHCQEVVGVSKDIVAITIYAPKIKDCKI